MSLFRVEGLGTGFNLGFRFKTQGLGFRFKTHGKPSATVVRGLRDPAMGTLWKPAALLIACFGTASARLNGFMAGPHRLLSSSFLGLPYRILNMNLKKELLRGPWGKSGFGPLALCLGRREILRLGCFDC